MKAIVNIKTDKDLKEAAQELAEELGFSLSAVVNASLKEFVRNKEVYFSSAPKMTPYLESLIEDAESDIRAKKNISKAFHASKDIDAYLDA